MDGKTVLTIVVPVVLLALIYGVPYLWSLRSKTGNSGWSPDRKPPAGTVAYIKEIRARMHGVKYVDILDAIEAGETPDAASQRAALFFHDLYMAGSPAMEEGEAAK